MERFSHPYRRSHTGPGDTLLLYTDGITEAANHQGTLWGEDRLADIIRQNVDLSAEQLIQKI